MVDLFIVGYLVMDYKLFVSTFCVSYAKKSTLNRMTRIEKYRNCFMSSKATSTNFNKISLSLNVLHESVCSLGSVTKYFIVNIISESLFSKINNVIQISPSGFGIKLRYCCFQRKSNSNILKHTWKHFYVT